jgi:predicted phosphoribosyltransferase
VERVFRDRRDAGQALARLLQHHRARPDVVVLALPRGGVPVAYEIATALGAPLDVFRVRTARLERAIGVIYRPETERQSHYFHARVADQFDAVIHIDETRAVEPLERTARWDEGEVPETFPFAV